MASWATVIAFGNGKQSSNIPSYFRIKQHVLIELKARLTAGFFFSVQQRYAPVEVGGEGEPQEIGGQQQAGGFVDPAEGQGGAGRQPEQHQQPEQGKSEPLQPEKEGCPEGVDQELGGKEPDAGLLFRVVGQPHPIEGQPHHQVQHGPDHREHRPRGRQGRLQQAVIDLPDVPGQQGRDAPGRQRQGQGGQQGLELYGMKHKITSQRGYAKTPLA